MTDHIISLAETAADFADAASLFAQYAATLPITLDYQGFDDEIARLPGKYAAPKGEILLARGANGAAVGCVGIRPLDVPGCCELKRLFTVPAARGTGLGRRLTEAAILAARTMGHIEMRLDTLSSMTSAIGLYDSLGFRRCPPYYGPTPPGTVFMALSL